MSFFGSVFAALTMNRQWHIYSLVLLVPFVIFLVIGALSFWVIHLPGDGIKPSAKAMRAIMGSSIGEGIGLLIASNLVINLNRPDLLLPAMALIVGLHFLPIAFAAAFRPFYILGTVLILAALVGFVTKAPANGVFAGFSAACALWLAAALAVNRDWRSKRAMLLRV